MPLRSTHPKQPALVAAQVLGQIEDPKYVIRLPGCPRNHRLAQRRERISLTDAGGRPGSFRRPRLRFDGDTRRRPFPILDSEVLWAGNSSIPSFSACNAYNSRRDQPPTVQSYASGRIGDRRGSGRLGPSSLLRHVKPEGGVRGSALVVHTGQYGSQGVHVVVDLDTRLVGVGRSTRPTY